MLRHGGESGADGVHTAVNQVCMRAVAVRKARGWTRLRLVASAGCAEAAAGCLKAFPMPRENVKVVIIRREDFSVRRESRTFAAGNLTGEASVCTAAEPAGRSGACAHPGADATAVRPQDARRAAPVEIKTHEF